MPQVASAQAVTFTADVAPILIENCVTCHRAGGQGPMSLETYDAVRPWAPIIADKVASRQMPPFHIDSNIGIQSFKGDRRLSDQEIATLVSWVESGAEMGDPALMPELPVFPDATAWEIGEPDIVVDWYYELPATGPDHFGSLYSEPINVPGEGDRYIKAIQSRPYDNQSMRTVHHALSHSQGQGDGGAEEQFLVEYASGKRAEFYPDDAGVLVPDGESVRLSYHLHPIGEPVSIRFQLGIVLHPEGYVPEHRRWTKQMARVSHDIDLPPNQVTRTDGYFTMQENAMITAFQPHMHALGRYQCIELIYPSGSAGAATETVSCAHWDYNWHTIYNYADDVAPIAPKGTVVHLISYFDNTHNNPGANDPDNWAGDGERTVDEMSFAWIGWIELTDEEYTAKLEERKRLRQEAEAVVDATVAR
jgi:hypothetical protein